VLSFVLLSTLRADLYAKRLQLIDRNVARGSHYVECILLGSEGTSVPPFKIIGVFAT
jgi:hypothetical protein